MEKLMKRSDLELFLKQYNLWYRGMTILEMHHCRQALENSLNESSASDNSTNNSSIGSAGCISTSISSDPSCSSEMITYNSFSNFRYSIQPMDPTSTYQSSPTRNSTIGQRIVIRADVHHPMDWSPKKHDDPEPKADEGNAKPTKE